MNEMGREMNKQEEEDNLKSFLKILSGYRNKGEILPENFKRKLIKPKSQKSFFKGESKKEKHFENEDRKLQEMYGVLKNTNLFLDLYWDNHGKYIQFLSESNLLNRKEEIEKATIDPHFDASVPCFVCNKNVSVVLRNYEEKARFEDYYEHKEPFCWEEDKRIEFRCDECKRNNLKTQEHIKHMIQMESSEDREERVRWLKDLNIAEYSLYLKSFHWWMVKYAKKEADKPNHMICNRCQKRQHDSYSLNYHHKTYSYIGEEEDHLESIETLCRTCHNKHHGVFVPRSTK